MSAAAAIPSLAGTDRGFDIAARFTEVASEKLKSLRAGADLANAPLFGRASS